MAFKALSNQYPRPLCAAYNTSAELGCLQTRPLPSRLLFPPLPYLSTASLASSSRSKPSSLTCFSTPGPQCPTLVGSSAHFNSHSAPVLGWCPRLVTAPGSRAGRAVKLGDPSSSCCQPPHPPSPTPARASSPSSYLCRGLTCTHQNLGPGSGPGQVLARQHQSRWLPLPSSFQRETRTPSPLNRLGWLKNKRPSRRNSLWLSSG